jgi:hypothetical protein
MTLTNFKHLFTKIKTGDNMGQISYNVLSQLVQCTCIKLILSTTTFTCFDLQI